MHQIYMFLYLYELNNELITKLINITMSLLGIIYYASGHRSADSVTQKNT